MEEGTGIQSILKIAVVGVESTGKTSLCKALAEAYDTAYTVEVAREYLMTHGKSYKSIDLEKISELQLAEEDEKTCKANELLFCDTTLLVTKIWHEVVFGEKNKRIDALYKPEQYILHILCDIDIPWEFDELRENPSMDDRKKLFKMYEEELKRSGALYLIASGEMSQRIEACKRWIEKIKPT